MNRRLIYTSAFVALFGIITSPPCVARVHRPAKLEGEVASVRYASDISIIKSAIQDEMVVASSVKTARRYGVESAGQVSLDLEVLIAPFVPSQNGFSTHVIYLVPGYGYVLRQVSIYPKKKLALFWLGYSAQGPGTDTGFNCTHSRSNCKIQDIPFDDLRTAFRSWWVTRVEVEIGNSGAVRAARQRNAERARLIEQSLHVVR